MSLRIVWSTVSLALIAALGYQGLAQQSPATKPAAVAAPAAEKPAPSLSEAENLRLQVITLKASLASLQQKYDALVEETRRTEPNYQSIDEQMKQLNAEYGAAMQQIQIAHPGYVLNPQTGKLTAAPKPAQSK
jgi:hypothetical protein